MEKKESFTRYGVMNHPFQFLYLFSFAFLGGIKIGLDLVGIPGGTTDFGQVVPHYVGAILATVVLYFSQKKKAAKESQQG